jgi:DNA-binding transcriptional regulator YbjK
MALSRKLVKAGSPARKGGRLPRPNPRLVKISDAALRVIAQQGARGLTHRGVDRMLAVAEGSTSAYFRTRAQLLAAAANRLCQLDLLDVHWMARLARARLEPVDAKYFAGLLAATFADWLSDRKRVRTLARCELFLEATRDAQLRKIMARTQRAFLRQTVNFFRGIGTKNASRAAEIFVDFALGLLYGRATSLSRHVSKKQLEDLILSAVQSLVKT